MDNVIYMIEADPMLSAVKQHIADTQRVRDEVRALADSFGAQQIFTDRRDGRLTGCVFGRGAHHADFKKGDRKYGRCFPKKDTEAYTKFADQVGYPWPVKTIATAFNIPLSLSYGTDGTDRSGWTCIGNMLSECGFLYLGAKGPYALWIPDVAGEIAEMEARGHVVNEKFDMVLPGCRRILNEEWEVMVAQHNLEQARTTKAAA